MKKHKYKWCKHIKLVVAGKHVSWAGCNYWECNDKSNRHIVGRMWKVCPICLIIRPKSEPSRMNN